MMVAVLMKDISEAGFVLQQEYDSYCMSHAVSQIWPDSSQLIIETLLKSNSDAFLIGFTGYQLLIVFINLCKYIFVIFNIFKSILNSHY